jgi:hypothetical protein
MTTRQDRQPLALEQLLAAASAVLEPMGARLIDFEGTRITIEAGLGPRKRRSEVELDPLRNWIDANPSRARLGIASFLRGAAAPALAPRPSRREERMTFQEAAATTLPSIEGPLFETGVRQAADDDYLIKPAFIDDDLVEAYFLELDAGRRLLTQADLARWSVSFERIEKAALSVLLHRTYNEVPTPRAEDVLAGCKTYRTGDGYDGARALLLESLQFELTRRGMVFAIPSCRLMLFAPRPPDDEALAPFRRHLERVLADDPWPLSSAVYCWEGGRAQLLEEPT